jgi:hypothetical protein
LAPTRFDDEANGTENGLYQRVIDIKNKNSDIKVLLAVGGEGLIFLCSFI